MPVKDLDPHDEMFGFLDELDSYIDGEVYDEDDDPTGCWGNYTSDINAQSLAEKIGLLSKSDSKMLEQLICCLGGDCLSCQAYGKEQCSDQLILNIMKRLR